jgi:hypothetical protein
MVEILLYLLWETKQMIYTADTNTLVMDKTGCFRNPVKLGEEDCSWINV